MVSNALALLDKDWYGVEVPGSPSWALWAEDGNLLLRGSVASTAIALPEDECGAFVEGLWEGDAVELFLLNPASGFYIEFNLAPRGAWWCCTFDAPRNRAAIPAPLPGVRAHAHFTENRWDSSLAIPIRALPPALDFKPGTTKGNITFCLGSPQQFVTLADLGGGAPDFHRPEKWIGVHEMMSHTESQSKDCTSV